MAITTRAELHTAVANWLNRSDLTDRIPEFVALAEARMTRVLRDETVDGTLTLNASSVALPADCAELRSIRLASTQAHLDYPIEIVTLEMLAEVRARRAGATGRPTHAAVVGAELFLAPVPSESYTAFITYYTTLEALSDAVTSNSLLTSAPDVYLYGALTEAEPYLQNDERVPLWQRRFEVALAELAAARNAREFSASLRPARLPRVF